MQDQQDRCYLRTAMEEGHKLINKAEDVTYIAPNGQSMMMSLRKKKKLLLKVTTIQVLKKSMNQVRVMTVDSPLMQIILLGKLESVDGIKNVLYRSVKQRERTL